MTELHGKYTDGIGDEFVAGAVSRGLESVREAFAANIRAGLEVGASFSVTYRGEVIVDLWGGHTDKACSALVHHNSLFNIWSTTKGLAAICIAMLVDRGSLRYDAPVCDYWPEFAQNGKSAVTVEQLMSHRAGLCGSREPVTIEDYYGHRRVASLLAAQAPFFEPGSAWGYHALTFGVLVDELVRRVDGRALGAFFDAEVATPFDLDIFMGLPEAQDHRQLQMIPPTLPKVQLFDIPNPSAKRAVQENPMLDASWPNRRDWRAAGLACCGGSANARDLARLYGALVNDGELAGRRLLSPKTIADATRERIAGVDQVSGAYDRYAAGFRLNRGGNMGACQQSFGHQGWGGSIAFGDPQRKLGVAYTMNQMVISDWDSIDPRLSRLLSATYSALDTTI